MTSDSDLVKRHQQKIAQITGPCSCIPGFKDRGLIDPACMFHECAHDIAELLDRIEALERGVRLAKFALERPFPQRPDVAAALVALAALEAT